MRSANELRCCQIPDGLRGDIRLDLYTLLEIRGIIIGLEATGASSAVHFLKQLHNRVVYLEAEKAEQDQRTNP